jgi:hypothetical protein
MVATSCHFLLCSFTKYWLFLNKKLKKLISYSALFFALLISCNTNSSKSISADETFAAFTESISKKDFVKAKSLATKESEMAIGIMQMGMAKMGDKGIDKFDKSKIDFGKAIISGDKALIPLTDKQSGMVINFPMQKVDGDWKVAFDEKSLFEMAFGSLENNPALSDSLKSRNIINTPAKK